MRTTNGNSSPQAYRPHNVSKRQRMTVKPKLTPQLIKRPIATKFKNQSAHNEEYDDDDIYSDDLEEEPDDSEWQPEQSERPTREQKSSSMRPLLQLLSDNSSRRPGDQIGKAPTSAAQKRIYQDIDLVSDDEELTTKVEAEDSQIEDELQDVQAPKRKKKSSGRRFLWTPKSTSRIIDLWEKYLKDIRGKRKNTEVHKQMAAEMSEYGVTHREIKFKMDNLTKKYKIELEKIASGKETNWRQFKRVQYFLHGKVDFEQIMFDNAESSPFFEFDHSEAGSQEFDLSQEDLQLKEEVEQEEENIIEQTKEESPPKNVKKMPEKKIYRPNCVSDATAPKSERILQIEEEKLEIEKQKLLVMKHISQNLSSISKTLVELLRNTKK
ncbi:uncharacterized protein LOC132792490 [Drosophila nasuta]|uniref:uncharacterized protein LOC132792490 n=1 Tax=Drosophila nasuta TaxID=42062 RepID=UPI00295EE744|nr:uncharacterized protein LOC132792490 [Drosophila nasuta]